MEAEVHSLVTSGDVDVPALRKACSGLELVLALAPPEGSSAVLYSTHLLACLLQSDVDAARFLWKRVPEVVKPVFERAAACPPRHSCWPIP